MRNDFFKHILLSGGSRQNRTELETEVLPYAFNSNGHRLRNYRIYGNTINGDSVGDLVTEGEHAGKYCVPVTVQGENDESKTVNIELDEPLRKVGDDVDYIDFREQKQHRVSRNKLPLIGNAETVVNNGITFVNNGNGTITISGTAGADGAAYVVNLAKEYIIPISVGQGGSGCMQLNNTISFYGIEINLTIGFYYNDTLVDSWSLIPKYRINNAYIGQGGKTINNIRFIVTADKPVPSVSVSPAFYEDGTTELIPFEPYMSDFELDVTLPALSTVAGTNTLSVDTETQPSKIYIQGNITEIETVSAETQALQTNIQSLQPLLLDENAELDVMPSDNLETTGDEENAE